ncbi:MAG: hypothetical protein HWE10_14740 [Gammaproteobacteria bacterium]|nr:hypothetical protein [Gammaproteobacteria bacterium]
MKARLNMLVVMTISLISFNTLALSDSTGFFFSGAKKEKRAADLTPMFAPESVKKTIVELELLRPHLNETCIFGAAMLLNDLGEQAQNALDEETKCIHTLVIHKQRHDAEQAAKKELARVTAESIAPIEELSDN